jgi:phospholipid/cholesterol/gamma-HCH transport system ATP-binding protein
VSRRLPAWLSRRPKAPRAYVRPARGAELIRFQHLSKSFGDHLVFQDLDLAVNEGETLTVIGGSGSGKSVLLKCLVGLVTPDSGKVVFEGQDLGGFDEDDYRPVRQRIALVFQSSALFDSLSVSENIAYPIREQSPGLSRAELEEKVQHTLELVDLRDAGRLRPSELSGGMRKRVGLARAIANHPDVILWDEPTTGLDPLNVRMINDLICQMHRDLRCTSVVVTHDMESAFRISDRIAMLAHNRILAVGPVDEMRASAQPEVRAFFDAQA